MAWAERGGCFIPKIHILIVGFPVINPIN
jgi:hypothetical protein